MKFYYNPLLKEKFTPENDAFAASADKTSPPIQVHEVTSTAHENGTKGSSYMCVSSKLRPAYP